MINYDIVVEKKNEQLQEERTHVVIVCILDLYSNLTIVEQWARNGNSRINMENQNETKPAFASMMLSSTLLKWPIKAVRIGSKWSNRDKRVNLVSNHDVFCYCSDVISQFNFPTLGLVGINFTDSFLQKFILYYMLLDVDVTWVSLILLIQFNRKISLIFFLKKTNNFFFLVLGQVGSKNY